MSLPLRKLENVDAIKKNVGKCWRDRAEGPRSQRERMFRQVKLTLGMILPKAFVQCEVAE